MRVSILGFFILCCSSVRDTLGQQVEWENLCRWIESDGGNVSPGVLLKEIPGYGRGIVATENLEKGFDFARIPVSNLLTLETVLEQSRLNRSGKLNALRTVDVFALFLLDQSKYEENREWKAYFDTIPKDIPNSSPLFYTHEKVEAMKSRIPEVAREVELYSKAVGNSFFHFKEVFEAELPNMTLAEYNWAVSTVQSRLFGVMLKKENSEEWSKSNAFAPLADLINTQYPPNELNADCLTDENSEYFVCSTTQNVPAGNQLFVPYIGAMDKARPINKHLLITYGFVLDTKASPESEDGRLFTALHSINSDVDCLAE